MEQAGKVDCGTSAVEVVPDQERPALGKCLRAARAVAGGGLLVRERYLSFVSLPVVEGWRQHVQLYAAIAQGRHAATTPEGSVPGSWGAGFDGIRQADLAADDQGLAKRVRAEIRAGEEGAKLPDDIVEQMVYLSCVFHLNSYSFPGEDGRRNDVLFPTICRANHSCAPNAVLVPCATRDETKLIALRPIAPGDPVETCFCPNQYLLRTISQRRAVIQQKWGWTCQCRRCEAPTDLTRCFAVKCAACGAASAAAASASTGASSTLSCTACGRAAEDGPAVEQLLAEEAEAEAFLLSLQEPDDLDLDVEGGTDGLDSPSFQQCASFASKHPAHHVAAEVWRRQAVLLHSQGKLAEAAAAQKAFVAAVKALFPPGIRGLAWFVELHCRLAYLLELAGQRQEARAALRQMLENMELCSGRTPSPGMVFDLIECPSWWKFLQEVGPELI